MKSGVRDVLELPLKDVNQFVQRVSLFQFTKARLISYSMHTPFHLHFAQQQGAGRTERRREKGSKREQSQWEATMSEGVKFN